MTSQILSVWGLHNHLKYMSATVSRNFTNFLTFDVTQLHMIPLVH